MLVADMPPCGDRKATLCLGWVLDLLSHLSEGGYSNEEIGKVIGGNLLRVYEQVWG